MGFLIIWDFNTWFFSRFSPSRKNCKTVFFRPSGAVKLYFSIPVELYTVFSLPKTLAKKPGQKSGQKYGQKSGRKFGHADHVLKTPLYIERDVSRKERYVYVCNVYVYVWVYTHMYICKDVYVYMCVL